MRGVRAKGLEGQRLQSAIVTYPVDGSREVARRVGQGSVQIEQHSTNRKRRHFQRFPESCRRKVAM